MLRSVLILIILFLLTKWLGRKQLAHLSYFEYIAGITIGSIAAEVSIGLDKDFLHGIYSLFVWSAIPFLAGLIGLKSPKFRDFIEGKYTVVIKNGKILEDNLAKEKYTVDELLELLRKKNAFQVADVEFGILEANGELNVYLKKEKQPITPSDLQLDIAPEKVPQTVITEGRIMDDALSSRGLTRAWLYLELARLNVTLDNVYIGQVDTYGQLTVDIYDDKIELPQPKPKQLLLYSMKKCQADLELYALQTESQEAIQMYKRNAKKMETIIERTTYLLKE